VVGNRSSLSLSKSTLASRLVTNWRDDQAFPIRGNVQLGIRRDAQELEDRFVDDDPGAIANCLEMLDHGEVITPLGTVAQAVGPQQSWKGEDGRRICAGITF